MRNDALEIVKEFYKRMNTNDYQYAAELLSENYCLDWPQSNERIRGKKNFIAVNEEYPTTGSWKFRINRIIACKSEAVSDVTISDNVKIARAITFTEIKNRRIVKQTEYWPQNYSAPENRKHLVELIDA